MFQYLGSALLRQIHVEKDQGGTWFVSSASA
jgi:hypothetical protein